MKIFNPASGMLITELKDDRAESIQEKFTKARRAQKEWSAVPLRDRLRTLRRFGELLAQNQDRLARTLTMEVGKPISQSRSELKGTIGRVEYFLEKTTRYTEEEKIFHDAASGMDEKITHEPLGTLANISAWNYPYFVGSNVFVPALLTGNAVMYKPSEFAALTGESIVELMVQAGVPQDAFPLILGDGNIGAELLRMPIDGVFFTGSFATGKKIAETVAPRMIKMQLELGGKDPVYVCEDVDIGFAAAALAEGAFYNGGQSCCAVERLYVHQKIFNAFVDAFVEAVKAFVVGDPMDEKTSIGPLTRAAHLHVLERQVADASANGARVLCGGQRMNRPGNYFEPTVIVDVNHTMELMREETFGPLIGIQKVSNDEEALDLMSDTDYGLTAGIYTKDQTRAESLLSKLRVGSAYWNCCDRVSPRLPWSGRGHSGLGVTLSHYGIQTFVQPKAWHLRSVR